MNRNEQIQKNEVCWFHEEDRAFVEKDEEWNHIVTSFLCGDVLERNRLTNVQKALIILAVLTASHMYHALPKYVRSAYRIGATISQIKETLYQCTPYIGMETVHRALQEVNQVLAEEQMEDSAIENATVNEETRFEKGLLVQKELFDAANIEAMRANAPKDLQHIQAYLSAYCFGDFYTRGGLDFSMRELITFCALGALGGCEPQVKAHISANLRVGNDREVLIAAITQCLPFIGFPKTLNVISCIDQVVPAKEIKK